MSAALSEVAPVQAAPALLGQRLGDLLAAIGNHEAKALTFLAMQENVAYGVTAIYRRFLEIQGPSPVFTGQVTVAQKYVVHSFAPIGLVAKERNECGFLRHVRHDPDGHATALAGFLLAYTETHPAALTQIFGSTATNSLGVADERPPMRRLRILRALVDGSTGAYTRDIAHRADVREMVAGDALTRFHNAGLLTYHSRPTYDLQTVYRIETPLVFPYTGHSGLRDAIGDFLNQRLEQAGGPFEISREEIEEHVRGLSNHWRNSAGTRDGVQKAMKTMVTRGQLTALSAHYGPTHSQLSMSEAQREFIVGLIGGIDAIAAGAPNAIASGCAAAAAIVNEPERVRPLIRRAFAANKLASNPISGPRKLREVLQAIENTPGMTSAELLVVLDSTHNKASVSNTVAELARTGRIYGVVQTDGPYKRWYPTSDGPALSMPSED